MHLSRTKRIALIGGAAAAIGLGVVAGPVLADSVMGDQDGHHDDFARDLAAKLGVPQSKVDNALESMQGDRLAQRLGELQQSGALTADQVASIKGSIAAGDVDAALKQLRATLTATQLDALVKQGDVTQAQADQVAALVKAGAPIGLRMEPKPHTESADHQRHQVQELQQRGALTAEQAAQISALIDAGKTAQAETQLHTAMDTGMLEELVQRKVVTETQAGQIRELMAAGVPIGIGGPGGHRGPGMDGDHRGPDMDGDHGRPEQGGGLPQQSYDGDADSA